MVQIEPPGNPPYKSSWLDPNRFREPKGRAELSEGVTGIGALSLRPCSLIHRINVDQINS